MGQALGVIGFALLLGVRMLLITEHQGVPIVRCDGIEVDLVMGVAGGGAFVRHERRRISMAFPDMEVFDFRATILRPARLRDGGPSLRLTGRLTSHRN